MIEKFQNIWSSNVDVVCVTTNGSVFENTPNKEWNKYSNPMGGGIALEATFKIPNVVYTLGNLIMTNGNRVQYIGQVRRQHHKSQQVFAFPTMCSIGEKASTQLIKDSLLQLIQFHKIYPNLTIGLPRPGCNIGGLDWESQVKPLIQNIFNAFKVDETKIVIYHYDQNR